MSPQNKITKAIGAFSSGVGAFIAAEIALWLISSMLPWPMRSGYRYGSSSYYLPHITKGSVVALLSSCIATYVATSRFGRLGFTWGVIFGAMGGGINFLSKFIGGGAAAPWSYFFSLLPLAASVGTGLWMERVFGGAGEASSDSSGESSGIPGASPDLELRISGLEEKVKVMDNVLERLSRLEGHVAGLELSKQTAANVMPQPQAPQPAAVLPAFQAPRSSKPAPPKKPQKEFSLDELLEGRWLSRLGMSIFLLGVAFFLKYSFENQWIGPIGRIILGIIAGAAFILSGDKQQKKGLALYGQTLTGGGIGILYLSVFGAFHLYHFLDQIPAFLVMVLITLTAVVLALRYSSITIIVLAMLGGFATPALLSTGVVREVPLFTYLAILSFGVLAVSSFKNWRPINLLAFLLTQIWIQGYFAGSYYKPEKLGILFFFTTLYFAIFLIPNLRFNILKQIRSEAADLVLLLGNAGIYYLTVYFRLLEGSPWESWEAYLAVLASAIYFVLVWATHSRSAEDKYLLLSELGVATTFATIAIPVALDWEWVTIGWAIEALILLWIGFNQKDRWTRWAGNGLFLAVGARLLIHDEPLRSAYEFLLTTRSLSFLAALGLMAAGIKLTYDRFSDLTQEEQSFSSILPIAWNFLFLLWLCVEAKDYLKHRYVLFHPTISLDQYTVVTFSIIWTIYAFVLMGIGLVNRSKYIQLGAGVLFAVTTFKVILVDMSQLPLGSRVISFLVLGGLMLFVSYFIQKQSIKKESI